MPAFGEGWGFTGAWYTSWFYIPSIHHLAISENSYQNHGTLFGGLTLDQQNAAMDGVVAGLIVDNNNHHEIVINYSDMWRNKDQTYVHDAEEEAVEAVQQFAGKAGWDAPLKVQYAIQKEAGIIPCPDCGGTGWSNEPGVKCPTCSGYGQIESQGQDVKPLNADYGQAFERENLKSTPQNDGCFGWINGQFFFAQKHHAVIMAHLVQEGWTWEQLMNAPQLWGWYNYATQTYDHDQMKFIDANVLNIDCYSDSGRIDVDLADQMKDQWVKQFHNDDPTLDVRLHVNGDRSVNEDAYGGRAKQYYFSEPKVGAEINVVRVPVKKEMVKGIPFIFVSKLNTLYVAESPSYHQSLINAIREQYGDETAQAAISAYGGADDSDAVGVIEESSHIKFYWATDSQVVTDIRALLKTGQQQQIFDPNEYGAPKTKTKIVELRGGEVESWWKKRRAYIYDSNNDILYWGRNGVLHYDIVRQAMNHGLERSRNDYDSFLDQREDPNFVGGAIMDHPTRGKLHSVWAEGNAGRDLSDEEYKKLEDAVGIPITWDHNPDDFTNEFYYNRDTNTDTYSKVAFTVYGDPDWYESPKQWDIPDDTQVYAYDIDDTHGEGWPILYYPEYKLLLIGRQQGFHYTLWNNAAKDFPNLPGHVDIGRSIQGIYARVDENSRAYLLSLAESKQAMVKQALSATVQWIGGLRPSVDGRYSFIYSPVRNTIYVHRNYANHSKIMQWLENKPYGPDVQKIYWGDGDGAAGYTQGGEPQGGEPYFYRGEAYKDQFYPVLKAAINQVEEGRFAKSASLDDALHGYERQHPDLNTNSDGLAIKWLTPKPFNPNSTVKWLWSPDKNQIILWNADQGLHHYEVWQDHPGVFTPDTVQGWNADSDMLHTPGTGDYEDVRRRGVDAYRQAMYGNGTPFDRTAAERMRERWDEHSNAIPYVYANEGVYVGSPAGGHFSIMAYYPDFSWWSGGDTYVGRYFPDGEFVDWMDRETPQSVKDAVLAEIERTGRYPKTAAIHDLDYDVNPDMDPWIDERIPLIAGEENIYRGIPGSHHYPVFNHAPLDHTMEYYGNIHHTGGKGTEGHFKYGPGIYWWSENTPTNIVEQSRQLADLPIYMRDTKAELQEGWPAWRPYDEQKTADFTSSRLTSVVEETLGNFGGTWDEDLNPFTPESGYMVSLANYEAQIPADQFDSTMVNGYVMPRKQELDKPSNFYGTWLDNGIVYNDISRWIQGELEEALEIARQNNQLSIWDAANKEVIYVDNVKTSYMDHEEKRWRLMMRAHDPVLSKTAELHPIEMAPLNNSWVRWLYQPTTGDLLYGSTYHYNMLSDWLSEHVSDRAYDDWIAGIIYPEQPKRDHVVYPYPIQVPPLEVQEWIDSMHEKYQSKTVESKTKLAWSFPPGNYVYSWIYQDGKVYSASQDHQGTMYHVNAEGGHEQTGFDERGLFVFDSIDEAISFGNGWLEKKPKFLYAVVVDPTFLRPDTEWEEIEEEPNEHAMVYEAPIPVGSVKLLDTKDQFDYWKPEDFERLTGQKFAQREWQSKTAYEGDELQRIFGDDPKITVVSVGGWDWPTGTFCFMYDANEDHLYVSDSSHYDMATRLGLIEKGYESTGFEGKYFGWCNGDDISLSSGAFADQQTDNQALERVKQIILPHLNTRQSTGSVNQFGYRWVYDPTSKAIKLSPYFTDESQPHWEIAEGMGLSSGNFYGGNVGGKRGDDYVQTFYRPYGSDPEVEEVAERAAQQAYNSLSAATDDKTAKIARVEWVDVFSNHGGGLPFIYDKNNDVLYIGMEEGYHYDLAMNAGIDSTGSDWLNDEIRFCSGRIEYGEPTFYDGDAKSQMKVIKYIDTIKPDLEDLGMSLEAMQRQSNVQWLYPQQEGSNKWYYDGRNDSLWAWPANKAHHFDVLDHLVMQGYIPSFPELDEYVAGQDQMHDWGDGDVARAQSLYNDALTKPQSGEDLGSLDVPGESREYGMDTRLKYHSKTAISGNTSLATTQGEITDTQSKGTTNPITKGTKDGSTTGATSRSPHSSVRHSFQSDPTVIWTTEPSQHWKLVFNPEDYQVIMANAKTTHHWYMIGDVYGDHWSAPDDIVLATGYDNQIGEWYGEPEYRAIVQRVVDTQVNTPSTPHQTEGSRVPPDEGREHLSKSGSNSEVDGQKETSDLQGDWETYGSFPSKQSTLECWGYMNGKVFFGWNHKQIIMEMQSEGLDPFHDPAVFGWADPHRGVQPISFDHEDYNTQDNELQQEAVKAVEALQNAETQDSTDSKRDSSVHPQHVGHTGATAQAFKFAWSPTWGLQWKPAAIAESEYSVFDLIDGNNFVNHGDLIPSMPPGASPEDKDQWWDNAVFGCVYGNEVDASMGRGLAATTDPEHLALIDQAVKALQQKGLVGPDPVLNTGAYNEQKIWTRMGSSGDTWIPELSVKDNEWDPVWGNWFKYLWDQENDKIYAWNDPETHHNHAQNKLGLTRDAFRGLFAEPDRLGWEEYHPPEIRDRLEALYQNHPNLPNRQSANNWKLQVMPTTGETEDANHRTAPFLMDPESHVVYLATSPGMHMELYSELNKEGIVLSDETQAGWIDDGDETQFPTVNGSVFCMPSDGDIKPQDMEEIAALINQSHSKQAAADPKPTWGEKWQYSWIYVPALNRLYMGSPYQNHYTAYTMMQEDPDYTDDMQMIPGWVYKDMNDGTLHISDWGSDYFGQENSEGLTPEQRQQVQQILFGQYGLKVEAKVIPLVYDPTKNKVKFTLEDIEGGIPGYYDYDNRSVYWYGDPPPGASKQVVKKLRPVAAESIPEDVDHLRVFTNFVFSPIKGLEDDEHQTHYWLLNDMYDDDWQAMQEDNPVVGWVFEDDNGNLYAVFGSVEHPAYANTNQEALDALEQKYQRPVHEAHGETGLHNAYNDYYRHPNFPNYWRSRALRSEGKYDILSV